MIFSCNSGLFPLYVSFTTFSPCVKITWSLYVECAFLVVLFLLFKSFLFPIAYLNVLKNV